MQSTTLPLTTTATGVVAVATKGLSKSYRTGFWLNKLVSSLQNCTLEAYQGETFGLLGPNGAGKTTLLKILLGIVTPSAGEAFLLGTPLGDQRVKARIGYLPENPYFYDYLTGAEVLDFTGRLFSLDRSILKTRIPELIERVGLSQDAGAKQLRKYSKGMLQRIGLAQALINDPELVFLDEPMSGLDPTGRFQMRELILSLKSQGKTVFFNSHILSDVESICDRVGILAQGELVALGALDTLLGTGQTYQVRFTSPDPAQLAPYCSDLEINGPTAHGTITIPGAEFLQFLAQSGGTLIEMKRQRASLEAFFLECVRNKTTPH
jgi:ABC-2 type transport system ATP-binding protein